MKDKKDLTVGAAYALKAPEDSKALYRDWAATYDEDFAAAMDFLMPGHVAQIFAENGGAVPVLDVGAGTGLVAAELLKRGIEDVDGLDISTEMLAVATSKGLYRKTILADLTKRLPLPDASYHGVTSSGTFTHGHVGPQALDEMLRSAAHGAFFVLTIKPEHYAERGFEQKFDSFGDRIKDFSTASLPIYGAPADAAHAQDMGLIASFRKV